MYTDREREMFARGRDVKKHTCLSITIVNKHFFLLSYLTKKTLLKLLCVPGLRSYVIVLCC